MYIEQKEKHPNYDLIIAALCNGIKFAVMKRDKSHIAYILLRACLVAWDDLQGGYNNASDIKAILADVHDEFSFRMASMLKNRRKKRGDINEPLNLPKKPDTPKSNINKVEPIVDPQGKPLKSEDKK